MGHQRTHRSSSWTPPNQAKSSAIAPQSFAGQAYQNAHASPTQADLEHDTREQNLFATLGLQIGHRFANIPVQAPNEALISAPMQPRLVMQASRVNVPVKSLQPTIASVQRQEEPDEELSVQSSEQRPNQTRLPKPLKSGIEFLSGISLDAVKVHYNSPQPAQLQALAYTQGTHIYVSSGQEQHLAHEAWHVVQQHQGRVPPTEKLPDGRTLNDNPLLEAEADRMAEQAKQVEVGERMPPLQRMTFDENAPIQGVFRQFREIVPAKPSLERPFQQIKIQNVGWINSENQEVYVQVGTGPGDTVVPYIWVSPVKDPKVRVAIRHGISQLSQEQYLTGAHRNIPHFDQDWYPISEEERKQLDVAAKPGTEDVMTDDTNQTREDFTISPGKFEQGASQVPILEIGQAELAKVAKLADLITGFTAQVVVLPTAQGETSEGKALGFQEQRYTPDHVWVQNILISDERLNTQFGSAQESHTVSYTLSRNATIRLAGRTAQELIVYFFASFQHLQPLVENSGGQMLLRSVLVEGILQQLSTAKMPIDRWQSLLSNLIRIFFQVYQLSTAATYKRGKAKYHGEDKARDRLDEDDIDAYNQDETRSIAAMSKDIEKMIDVQFRVDALGVAQYAFAVNHWLDSLKVMYPNLMAEKGDKIIAPFMNKKLAPSFKQFVEWEQKQAKIDKPVQVETVKELLEYYNYAPGDIKNTQLDRPQLSVGGFVLPDIPLGILDTDFTASIAVAPISQGVPQNFSVGFGEDTPTTFPIEGYLASQVEIQNVTLGNRERPKTKFIKSQKSHTVAWTLVRHQMMGYQGKTIQQLLIFLAKNFLNLQSDIKKEDGLRVAEKSLEIIKHYEKKSLLIHEWQALISALVRSYLIAYSVAESASYVHPKELDKAQGHGEAGAMRMLRRAEYSLSSGESLMNKPEEVVAAAVGLMDAFIVEDPKLATLTPQAAINAYHHWNQAMTDAFPTVMQQGGEKIRAAMLIRQVSKTETFGSLIKAANQ